MDSSKQELDVVGEATSTGVGEASAVTILGLLKFAVLMLALEYLVFRPKAGYGGPYTDSIK